MRHVDIHRRLLSLLLALLTLTSTALISPPPTGAAESEYSGILHVIRGDPPPGSGGVPMVVFNLWEGGDQYRSLNVPDEVIEEAGGETALRQRTVTVRGFERGNRELDVSSIELEQADSEFGPFSAAVGADTVSGSQRWISIPCRFSDSVGSPPQPASWFQPLLGSTSTSFPGLNHYWRDVSYNQINIDGSTVINSWHTLPNTRNYYMSLESNPSQMLTQLGNDCATAAGGASVLSGYMGVNFLYDNDFSCCAWGGAMTLYGTGYKTTWMPDWGWSRQDILAHEMGHGYGLPHSSGPYNAVYDSHWDVMSRGGSCSQPHGTYGCVAVHPIAYYKDHLGWIASGTKTTVTPGATPVNYNLAPLSAPAPSGSLHLIRIPIQGSSSLFYTVEARRLNGYDGQIPGDAVILHRVNLNDSGHWARVVDPDNNGNPNDAGAMWTPGETFVDATNDTVVEVTGFNGSTYQVTVRCNACANIIDAEVVTASGPASVVQGQTATISAQVRNNGTASATVSVGISKNPAGFSETQSVTLNAGQSQTLQFSWPTTTQTATGNHTFTVTATLAGDSVSGNNSKTRTVRVDPAPSHDAEVVSIAGPASVVQGETATLSAQVRNNGNVTDTFSVSISKDPAGFSQTQSVTLNAGQTQTVTFNWSTTAQTATGNHAFTVTATVSGDTNPSNDAKTHTIRVDAPPVDPPVDPPSVVDAEVKTLDGPGSVTQGDTATLTAHVRNNGTSSATFDVSVNKNPSGFSDTRQVTLGAGQSQSVTFEWATTGETVTGNHTFSVSVTLNGDTVAGNNSKTHTVRVDSATEPPPPPPSPPSPPDGTDSVTVQLTAKCFQIGPAGNLRSDRCDSTTLAGVSGSTGDGYAYTFANIPAPADASLLLFPTSGGAACQADTLTIVAEPDGVQSFTQERICTTWEGERTIQHVPSFGPTWARTDLAIATGLMQSTWIWGPYAASGFLSEPYREASGSPTPSGWRGLTAYDELSWSGGHRLVVYLDKSRMEITHPEAVDDGLWYVTNGLLVVELTTGNLQLGDNTFEQRAPAQVNVAGDNDDPTGPTYATMGLLHDTPALPDGAAITQRVGRDGVVTDDASLAGYGVTAVHRVTKPGLDHQVASVFWNYMTATGLVYENGAYVQEALFENPFYATGLPITEAYWATVKVGGTYKNVLLQCFERRCLTYTPDNPNGWQVEAGNVGLHYYAWRYGE